MLTTPVRDQVARYVAYAGFGATVAITPWTNYDPVNIAKMVVIAIFSLIAFGHLFLLAKPIWAGPYRPIIILTAAFIVQMLIVMFLHDAPLSQQFFGTFGRNTGFLSYFSLALLLMVSAVVVGYSQGRKLTLALLYAGAFNAIYGWFQHRGIDPIPWNNGYNAIIGTLGNPNFSAALLGMTTVVAVAIGLGNQIHIAQRIMAFALAALSFYLALVSDSAQGPAIALVGGTIVVYQFMVKTMNWKWARIPYIALVLVMAVLSVLGTLQKGPLQSILYQSSVTYRGDYWRAGINMTADSPIIGVGLDSYGDYYRFAREAVAIERRGADVISNSAHNVFIDISASGGLPLILIYLAIFFLAVRASYRILSNATKYDWVKVSLVAAWIAYLTQSIVSINQLGLAVWGWILPGAIIGMDLNSKLKETPTKDGKGRRIYAPAKYLLTGVVSGLVAIAVSLWPIRYDANFRFALGSGDLNRLEAAAKSFPMSNYHLNLTAQKLIEANQYERALAILKLARDNNDRDFFAWNGISSFSNIVGAEREEVVSKLRELDPKNPAIPTN